MHRLARAGLVLEHPATSLHARKLVSRKLVWFTREFHFTQVDYSVVSVDEHVYLHTLCRPPRKGEEIWYNPRMGKEGYRAAATESAGNLIEVRNLRIAFRMGAKTSVPVRGVSFDVPAGGHVALVGESGCGKSLTALAIGGLVDRADISGEVRGSPRIAYVFQNPMQSLNPTMKILNQIAEAVPGGPRGRRARPAVAELLAAVGLPASAADGYPCGLSGGQQQRAMIAMALAQKPDLLIADEPTTALDVTTQREVLDLIAKVAGERGTAVLLITHNLGLVARYAQYVNVMYAGQIVESGKTTSLLAAPRHPYTQGLVSAVPRLDAPKDAPLADIPGTVPPPWDWPSGCAFHPRCPFAEPECSSNSFNGLCPRL